MKLRELLNIIEDVARRNKIAMPLICGGAVREKVLGTLKKLDDIDLTNGEPTIKNLAKEVEIELSKRFSITAKTMSDGHASLFIGKAPKPVLKLDFSSNFIIPNIDQELTKLGIKNITNMKREVYSRDFYCNSLIMSFDLKKVIDPTHQGIKDIKNKVIRTCLSPEITLGYNKNRIIRTVYLAAKLGFNIDPAIIDFISKNKNLISDIDPGYLSKTLNKAIEYNVDKTAEVLDTLDLWKALPITEALYPHYKKRFSKQAQLRKNLDYGEGFYANIQNEKSVSDFRKKRKKKRKKIIKQIRDMKLASNQQKCLTNVLRLLKKNPSLTIKMGPADRDYDTRHFWAEDDDGKVIDPTRSDYKHYGKGITFDLSKNNIDIKKLKLASDKPNLYGKLNNLRLQLSQSAQKVIDDWEQDDDGMDEDLGAGGVCDQVADAMSQVVSQIAGVDVIDGGQDGDDHAFIVVYNDHEAFGVDISPHIYETGGGYSWRKKKNVKIDSADIDIWKIDRKDLGEIEKNAYYNGTDEYLKDNFPVTNNDELETSMNRMENKAKGNEEEEDGKDEEEDDESGETSLEPTPYSPDMFYAMHGVDGLLSTPLSSYPGHLGEEETKGVTNNRYNPIFQPNGLFESKSMKEITDLFVKLSIK